MKEFARAFGALTFSVADTGAEAEVQRNDLYVNL